MRCPDYSSVLFIEVSSFQGVLVYINYEMSLLFGDMSAKK